MDSVNGFFWRQQKELLEEISKVDTPDALLEEERNRYDDALRNYRDILAVRNADIHEERVRMARSMLSKGYPMKEIEELTNLSLDEIEKLRH